MSKPTCNQTTEPMVPDELRLIGALRRKYRGRNLSNQQIQRGHSGGVRFLLLPAQQKEVLP